MCKLAVVEQTLRFPHVLDEYREAKERNVPPPLDHEQFAEIETIEPPDWDELIARLQAIQTGNAAAPQYEKLIEEIFSAIFYPSLCNPRKQHEIHDGRKRIDITYTNEARSGFFAWLSQHYSSAFLFVECKNYGKEIGNPEADQLSGRFSPSRGQVGLLVCRSVEDAGRLALRCRDTAKDSRGFIIALTDDDVISLMESAKTGITSHTFPLLSRKFQALVD